MLASTATKNENKAATTAVSLAAATTINNIGTRHSLREVTLFSIIGSAPAGPSLTYHPTHLRPTPTPTPPQ